MKTGSPASVMALLQMRELVAASSLQLAAIAAFRPRGFPSGSDFLPPSLKWRRAESPWSIAEVEERIAAFRRLAFQHAVVNLVRRDGFVLSGGTQP